MHCRLDEEITEKWTGRNVLVCRGRVFMGPAYYAILLTLGAITVPYIVFLIFPVYVQLFSPVVYVSQLQLGLHAILDCPHPSL